MVAGNEDGHVCRCQNCDLTLSPFEDYGTRMTRTSPDHLGTRFGDWRVLIDDPKWFPIILDGQEVREVYEVDKPRGVVWAYQEPVHLCHACLAAGERAHVCARRLEGVVAFGEPQGIEAARRRWESERARGADDGGDSSRAHPG